MSYAVFAHRLRKSFALHVYFFAHFSFCFVFLFLYNFLNILFDCMIRLNTKIVVLAMELWKHGSFTHSLDVSEESEYDLWSDRFGSWIGRSSKSRSPDSMKHLRYDRKSSSGYFLMLFIVVWLMFLFPHFMHVSRTQLHIVTLSPMNVLFCFYCHESTFFVVHG